MKLRILKDFSITELSAVDRGAQAPALAVLMKRIDTEKEPTMQKITEPLAFDSLESAMQHLAKMNGLSKSAAMSAAASRFPALLAKYRQEGDEMIAKHAEDRRIVDPPQHGAIAAFNQVVDEIAQRDRCPRSVAMSRAAHERPALYQDYQRA